MTERQFPVGTTVWADMGRAEIVAQVTEILPDGSYIVERTDGYGAPQRVYSAQLRLPS